MKALILGFGNLYRRDDGVGRAVVNGVRERLGQAPLVGLDDGFDGLGQPVDAVVLHQLVPELAETVAEYDRVIFVDAHVADLPELLHEERIEPAHCPASFISHQTHPATMLELAEKMAGRAPEGLMLSLRGHDFDFGEGLSPETAALVPLAVERVLGLLAGGFGQE